MLGKHQAWRVSGQAVMRDQGVAWPKLDCLKPSFLALTRRGTRNLNETGTEEAYRRYLLTTPVLSSSLSAHWTMRERNEREPKPLDYAGGKLNGDSLRQDARTGL
jgi:hypothetical protein